MLTATDALTIAIVNTTADRTGEYIGRKFAGNEQSPLHNPFPLPKGASDKARARVIQQFKRHINEAIARVAAGGGSTEDWLICQELDRLVNLARKGPLKLRCWCKPKACHGDVIKELIIEAIETGQIFCPDGIDEDESGCNQIDGQNPAPQPKVTTSAPGHRQGYGTCWKCGSPFQIPGAEQSKCSGECGWVATEKKNRFLGSKK